MEGMPKFPMLYPELKVPASEFDDSFSLQIKEYILLHFQADPSAFDNALQEVQALKKQVMKGHVDVEAACMLKRYYAQLLMMKTRFPMEKGDPIQVLFSWYERSMEIPSAHTHADVGYELACIMYQIGAVHANIGSDESRSTEDSIKNAFMHFQYGAWPFQYLRDNMDVAKFNTPEFDKDVLTFFVNVLLGQAQECLLEKSILDHRKGVVVAKLSVYLRDLYMECYKHLVNSAMGEVTSNGVIKMWSRTCILKSEVFGCIAMLYMGNTADEEQKFGERLGYFQAADVHLKRAIKCCEKEDRETVKESVRFIIDVVTAKLENAKKENDFIYHERVPKVEDLLNSVEGLCKVKPLSFDPLDPSVGGDDIFGSLLPPTVLAAVSRYEEEKAKMKRELGAIVSQKDDELESFLSSLNVSELRLDSEGDTRLPDMLLERNAVLNSQTDAVPHLLEELQRVSELAREADNKLSTIRDRLSAIDIPELRHDEGYLAITKEVERLTDHHTQARENNGELHRALAGHTTNLHLLTLPLQELEKKLAINCVRPASTPEGLQLSQALDKVREMQVQRASLIERLNEELEADSISKRLLAERDTDCATTFAAELKKHDKTVQYIEANLAAQANILQHVTETNADFAQQRRELQKANTSRSEEIMILVTAFDVYNDVCHKAKDGKRFYEKLIERVDKLKIAVDAIDSAYAEERRKRDDAKRSLEQKTMARDAARYSQDAVADFAPVRFNDEGRGNLATPPNRTRPRLGDYMDFYRNKMSKGGRPEVSSQYAVMPGYPPASPYNALAVDPPQLPNMVHPSSPAPSSVVDHSPQPNNSSGREAYFDSPQKHQTNQQYYVPPSANGNIRAANQPPHHPNGEFTGPSPAQPPSLSGYNPGHVFDQQHAFPSHTGGYLHHSTPLAPPVAHVQPSLHQPEARQAPYVPYSTASYPTNHNNSVQPSPFTHDNVVNPGVSTGNQQQPLNMAHLSNHPSAIPTTGVPQFAAEPRHAPVSPHPMSSLNYGVHRSQDAVQPAFSSQNVSYAAAPIQAPLPVMSRPPPAAPNQFATAPQTGPATVSPWHRNVTGGPTESAWHCGPNYAAGNATNMTTNGGNSNFQPGNMQPVQNNQFNPKPESNVDLLGSLLGDLQLPPAMQPVALQPMPMESQNLQKAAPISCESSSTTDTMLTGYGGGKQYYRAPGHPSSRPAAAVLPIQQHPSANHPAQEPVLSMAHPSSISICPKFTDTVEIDLSNSTLPT